MLAPARPDDVKLRRFPAPYRAMLAISNDIDLTSIHRLRALFRFINTREETPIGPGLGLDFGNSMWMYRSPKEMPRFGRRFAHEIAYWRTHAGEEKTAYADELIAYARAGWIDTLHTYGNFTSASAVGVSFTRSHAERAVAEMDRLGVRFSVWTNHGDRDNRQNIGAVPTMLGDAPDSDAYHADLMRASGVRFLWQAKHQATAGFVDPTQPIELADGGKMHAFWRMATVMDDAAAMRLAMSVGGRAGRNISKRPFAQVWAPRLMEAQLSASVLDKIVKDGKFLVVSQHLGDQATLPDLDPAAADALRRVADYQARGLVLVASVSRLLSFAVNRKAAVWSVVDGGDGPVIDIAALDDDVEGRRLPTLDDVRGFSFEAAPGVRLALASREIAESELVRHSVDGRHVTMVRWHEADVFDHTADFARRRRYVDLAGGPISDLERIWLRDVSAQALAWLNAAKTGRFKDASPQENYALNYSIGRYEIGLDHYGEMMAKLGFTGRLHGLDVGSGAGHWVHAFAALNNQATGVELRKDFVEIANGVARAAGLADRARSIPADGRALPFEAELFDVAWSHGVIMFMEHDRVLAEMNRVLKRSGTLYLGYTSIGHRLRIMERWGAGEVGRNVMRTTVNALFNQCLYRAGVFRTPGGRTRVYTREELQHTARYAGFSTVAAPQLQDQADAWRGRESTIDLMARKLLEPSERVDEILRAAAGDAEIAAAVAAATRYGAPEAALMLLDRAKLDEAAPEVLRARFAARLKAGRMRARDPLFGLLDADASPEARLLQAKFVLEFSRWPDAIERFDALELSPETRIFAVAARLASGALEDGLRLAEAAAAAHPEDFGCRLALLRLLEATAADDRLRAAAAEFLDDIEAGRVDPD